MSLLDRSPVLTVLGSGTALPDARRHSSSYHLDLDGSSVLLDCGPGTLHGLAEHGIEWGRLTHVVVSHFHNDHVGDLGALLFAMEQIAVTRGDAPLTLVGPRGFGDFLERLAAALGSHVLEPGFQVVVRTVGIGEPYEDALAAFTIEAHPTPHTEQSHAYRIISKGGCTLGYTGDTGPSAAVARFLSGCQVLLAECALTDPPSMDRHLSPGRVAELADVARPDLLVLTHVYPGQTPEHAAAQVSASYQRPVVAAHDGMRIEMTPEGPLVDPNTNPI